jgi:hypothetical protein
LATTRRALRPSSTSCCAVARPKNATSVGTPPILGRSRDVRGRIDAEDRDTRADEVLQEVAVVGGEFDDEVVGSESETLADVLDVLAGVLDPRRGVRREVGVFSEDLVGGDKLGKLDEPAPRANANVQRIEAFYGAERLGRHQALAKRRHPEIHDRQLERRTAEATSQPVGGEVAGRVRHGRSVVTSERVWARKLRSVSGEDG